MTDLIMGKVVCIPDTCDSYRFIPETWNRPGKLWVIWDVEMNCLPEDHSVFCAVYANTPEEAHEKVNNKYGGDDYRELINPGFYPYDAKELTFDENGVSNVWVW
jgi:hypothetical protein